MEEERKWDELNKDCLVDILARVGTEALAVSIPFVCKSWYGATLDTRCWNSLVFPRFSSPEFIKFAVARSQGSATSIVFNYNCPEQGLEHISAGCPSLKVLNLGSDLEGRIGPLLGDHIAKWKNLEKLLFCSSPSIKHVVKSIGIHCKKIVELDCSSTDFDDQDVQAIVEFLPNIKSLNLSYSTLYCGQLISIMRGCRDLDHLNVSYCIGFDPDSELLKLASHIQSFYCSGSKFEYFDDDESLFAFNRWFEDHRHSINEFLNQLL